MKSFSAVFEKFVFQGLEKHHYVKFTMTKTNQNLCFDCVISSLEINNTLLFREVVVFPGVVVLFGQRMCKLHYSKIGIGRVRLVSMRLFYIDL